MNTVEAMEHGKAIRALVRYTPIPQTNRPLVCFETLTKAFGAEHARAFRDILNRVIMSGSSGAQTLGNVEALIAEESKGTQDEKADEA